MTLGNVITFYSYKGGVGRTQSMANVAVLLSKWGYKVLCIDWDLEAPGLNLYFRDYIDNSDKNGLVELVEAYRDGENLQWEDFITSVKIPSDDTDKNIEVKCIFAGNQDSSYISRVQDLDWKNLYEKKEAGFFFEELRGVWKTLFDFILIDSRTGITDIGGICTVQMPDLVVAFLTANNQSFQGTEKIINSANAARKEFHFDRENILFLPILSRFESRVEYENSQYWVNKFSQTFRKVFDKWIQRKVEVSEIVELTKIPSIPFWSFGENLVVLEEKAAAPDSLSYAFETLTALLANKLSKSILLVHDRDAFVSTAKRKLVPGFNNKKQEHQSGESSGVRVYISFAQEDKHFFQLLLPHLEGLKQQGIIEDFYNSAEQHESYLDQCEIVLILLSSSYLVSEHARSDMGNAFSRGDTSSTFVIPVLVRPVDLKGTILERKQLLPRDGRPVSLWSSFDEAFLEVVYAIRTRVENFSEGSSHTNNFIYGPAVPPEYFYGRKQQLSHIKYRIGGRVSQSVNVVGFRRSGKSSILRYVRERIDEFCLPEQSPIVVLLDFQDRRFHEPIGIIRGLRRGIRKQTGMIPWKEINDGDLFEVEDGLEDLREQGHRLIVIFDGFEAIGERLERFHDWGAHWRSQASAGRLSLIIASRRPINEIYRTLDLTSPFSNIFSTVTLGSLDSESWQKLLEDGHLSDREIQWVYELAGYSPYYTQLAAYMVSQYSSFSLARRGFLDQAQAQFLSLWQELSKPEQLALKHFASGSQTQPQIAAVESLRIYGLLQENNQIFSQPFTEFVKKQS